MSRSLFLVVCSVLLCCSVTAAAVLTPSTAENRKPIGLLLLGSFFFANPALLVAASHCAEND
jgi:hypothetical protein|tara:strand:- start:9440 stop:9625 length:186 start_codon:yes stop_codon:yes gene_type:complete